MADVPDYYTTLGVQKSCPEAEIKKAYKKLALKWHPDKNQGSQQAERRFKEIAEAYATLGNADKRRQYDQVRDAPPLRSTPPRQATPDENFQWWGRGPGEGPGDPFARKPAPAPAEFYGADDADLYGRGAPRWQPSHRGSGFANGGGNMRSGGFIPHRFSLNEAFGLFDSLFAGQDPFADFTDALGGPLSGQQQRLGGMRSFSDSGSGMAGGSWDVKITKIKRADGSVVVERTDARSGQTTRSNSDCGATHRPRTNSDCGATHRQRASTYPSYQEDPFAAPYPKAARSHDVFQNSYREVPPTPPGNVHSSSIPAAGGMASGGGGGIERGNWANVSAPTCGGGGGQRGAFINWSSN